MDYILKNGYKKRRRLDRFSAWLKTKSKKISSNKESVYQWVRSRIELKSTPALITVLRSINLCKPNTAALKTGVEDRAIRRREPNYMLFNMYKQLLLGWSVWKIRRLEFHISRSISGRQELGDFPQNPAFSVCPRGKWQIKKLILQNFDNFLECFGTQICSSMNTIMIL